VYCYVKEQFNLMKKSVLHILFFTNVFLGMAYFTNAQTETLLNSNDSLWNVWENGAYSDSVRVKALQGFAYHEYGRSKPDSAKQILRMSIRFAEQKNLPQFIAAGYNELGETFIVQAQYDSANVYFNLALNYAQLCNCQKEISAAYNGLANALRNTKQYSLAIDYYLKSLAINLEIQNYSGVASIANNLGIIYRNRGDYSSAIIYFNQSLEIKRKLDELEWMGTTLSNMGLVYKMQGDFVKAMSYYNEAYTIDKKLGNTAGMATALNGMGNLFKQQGNYADALSSYQQALAYFEEIGNKKNYATVLMNIGTTFHLQTKFDSALVYYTKSLEINERNNDRNGLSVVYNNLGSYYYDCRNYTEAIRIHELGLAIKLDMGDKVGMAYSYAGLALCYYQMNSLDLATEYVNKSLAIGKETGDAYILKQAFTILYRTYIKQRNNLKASEYLFKLIDVIKGQVATNYFALGENEKEMYFATMQADVGRLFDFTIYFSDDFKSCRDSSYNLILQTKSLTLKSSTLLRNSISESHDSLVLKLYENWIIKRSEIADLLLKGKDVQLLENEANKMERELIVRSGAFADFNKIKNLSWNKVKDGLKDGEAAIEFVHFKSEIDTANPIIYAAFIVRKNSEHPDVVRLCHEEDLKQILGNMQGNNLSFIEKVYGKKSEAKKDLYEKIWQPLEPYLQGVKTVYYSPSGLLHKVSFAAICKEQDVYLSDVYNFRQMGSTGNLAFENNTEFGDLENFLLMGGVQYNSDTTEKEIWNYLPGSLAETDAINSYLSKKKFGVNYFKETNASESVFKEKIASSSIVHIATHGFFFPDPEQVREEMKSEKESESEQDLKFRGTTNYANWSFVNNKNPLMRSGIVLANANDVWQRNPLAEGEDGILTAQEVSNLDLRNTKLVVLSACETGLGDIKGSEGVYGLQRAFKMAGVKYLIMSLWQVPDKETSEFMILFYKNLIKEKDIPTAFQKTQKLMREKYDPYYWGAFVLIE
jgi:CHAT domain-containing protein/tetratricopeptide (TPR) repeat protein